MKMKNLLLQMVEKEVMEIQDLNHLQIERLKNLQKENWRRIYNLVTIKNYC